MKVDEQQATVLLGEAERTSRSGALHLRNILRRPRPFGSLLLVAAATTFSPIHMDAQNSSTNNAPQQSSSRFTEFKDFFHPQTSVSLGAFAQLTPTRINGDASVPGSFYTNGMSPTAGVLGGFRQQFRPWFGYSLNIGYTRVAERYTGNYAYYGTDGYDFSGKAHMIEMSLSYVARKHLASRMSGFFELGGGRVAFVPSGYNLPPTHSPYSPSFGGVTEYRPEGVAGVGIQLRLANSVGLGAEYRGLIYKNPVFGPADMTTVSSEPTLSLTYSFGHK